MRVVIIGAGGTGGLYGALLQRGGHDVTFLARGAHLAAIRERGLRIRSAQFGEFNVPARATENPADLGQADAVILAVKTYDLETASQAACQALGHETVVLTLQNGVTAPDEVAALVGRDRVLIGTTGLETTIAEPGVIDHLSGSHFITVSELDGPPTPRVEGLVETLKGAEINARVEPDGRRALWQKALFLIPLAAVTSVCESSIGPIRDLPETRRLALDVIAEVGAVAAACGYEVAGTEAEAAAAIDRPPASMKASMARDFERGNRTELDALSGAIVRLGEERGVPVPANRAIYAVLKLREQQFGR